MATRNIVPRATGEGGIGTAAKEWALGWINALIVTTINKLTITQPATGSTLTIADGKTLTVSDNADTKYIIKGDGISNRVLRCLSMTIVDGTDANTLKISMSNVFSGDTSAWVDNVAKNATTGIFWLHNSGYQLKILDAGITGTLVAVLGGVQWQNQSGVAIESCFVMKSTNDITVTFLDLAGASVDITAMAAGKAIAVNILYVTDA
jgi:hypothetical protein